MLSLSAMVFCFTRSRSLCGLVMRRPTGSFPKPTRTLTMQPVPIPVRFPHFLLPALSVVPSSKPPRSRWIRSTDQSSPTGGQRLQLWGRPGRRWCCRLLLLLLLLLLVVVVLSPRRRRRWRLSLSYDGEAFCVVGRRWSST